MKTVVEKPVDTTETVPKKINNDPISVFKNDYKNLVNSQRGSLWNS